MKKSFRCRFGIHKWVVRREPDIAPFHECTRCGKVRVTDPQMIGMGDAGLL
ncbi:MAG TPA: hypothetical protein VF000_05305 [Agromyces sp.]|jgi:hypothetical protein